MAEPPLPAQPGRSRGERGGSGGGGAFTSERVPAAANTLGRGRAQREGEGAQRRAPPRPASPGPAPPAAGARTAPWLAAGGGAQPAPATAVGAGRGRAAGSGGRGRGGRPALWDGVPWGASLTAPGASSGGERCAEGSSARAARRAAPQRGCAKAPAGNGERGPRPDGAGGTARWGCEQRGN